jgi:hypothetical protein
VCGKRHLALSTSSYLGCTLHEEVACIRGFVQYHLPFPFGFFVVLHQRRKHFCDLIFKEVEQALICWYVGRVIIRILHCLLDDGPHQLGVFRCLFIRDSFSQIIEYALSAIPVHGYGIGFLGKIEYRVGFSTVYPIRAPGALVLASNFLKRAWSHNNRTP